MLTLKEACHQVKEFHTLANILKEELKNKAFMAGSDFEILKTKYDYLNELVFIIENETYEKPEEKDDE